MAITLLRQETQIRNSDVYDDTVAVSEANFETNPTEIETDLNNMRSQLSNLMDGQAGDWFTDLLTPSALDTGTQRGVNNLNTDLHDLERKRVLVDNFVHVDVTVTNAQNWETLLIGELPSNTTAAIGAVTTEGTVAAFHTGSFDSHALDVVAGSAATSPKNLGVVVDSATHDPLLSSGRQIYCLFQVEENTDGLVMTGTTTKRAQLSFVRLNAGGTALEACPVADIEDQVIHYTVRERKALEDFNEQDFLTGAIIDIPTAATVDRQTAHDNQGATPVDVNTNYITDLEGAGLQMQWRDDAEAVLFRITEGSAGGTSEVALESDVDTFRSDAVVNDMDNGLAVDTGAAGTTINVGVTANQIDSGGALAVLATGNLDLDAGALLAFGDQYEAASGYDTPLVLSDASAEWDAFETAFGEVSLLNAIVQAKNTVGRRKIVSVCTVAAAADADVSGPSDDNNLDTDLGDLSAGTFVTDYDIFFNGVHEANGANAAANQDVYPGTALADGQLKFEHKVKIGDVITVIDWAE